MTTHTRILPLIAGLLACTTLTVTGCGLNRQPPPRYNTVVGEKHAPVLNPNGQGPSGLPIASAPPYPMPPGPPPYPAPDSEPLKNTVSVVPMPHTPQTMAGMPGPTDAAATRAMPPAMRPQAMPQPQEESGWFSGLFGSDDEEKAAARQDVGMPRKVPADNQPELSEEGMRAAPVEDVTAADMGTPPMMDAAAPVAEMPADMVAPPPMMTDSQGYPVLAETPPAPEGSDARLEAAREKLRAMQAAQNEASGSRVMQESFDATLQPAPAPTAEAPAAEWRPVEESTVTPASVATPMPSAPFTTEPTIVSQPMMSAPEAAYAPSSPQPMPAPASAQSGWQPITSGTEPLAAPTPVAVYASAASEPVAVVQDIPASAVAPEQGLPPIQLMPPRTAAPAISASRSAYIEPSRYEHRREVQALSPFRHQ